MQYRHLTPGMRRGNCEPRLNPLKCWHPSLPREPKVNNKPPAPTHPQPSKQERSHERYMPGDPIPVPDAVEANTESTWALFSDVPHQPEPDFLDTVPASMLYEDLAATVRK